MGTSDDDLPPWAVLPGEGVPRADAGGELPADARAEAALRWRLVLGRHGDEHLPLQEPSEDEGEGADRDLAERLEEGRSMDVNLDYLYDRELARRAHRTASGGGGGGLTVPAWLHGVRTLFPEEAVRVLERDALVRYGLTELVTDPEILRSAAPTEDLLKAILQFKHLMKGEVLDEARRVVREVVGQLAARLERDVAPALHGRHEQDRRPPRRTFRNTDWKRTVERNLRNWDPEARRMVVDRISYRHRQRGHSPWRIVVAVDQSGSMLDSLIHASVMAAIFATLPSVSVHLVLWDHRVVDVSHLASDPLEVLMSCQLGGGTKLLQALQYCASLITEPSRTLLVLVSDFYVFGEARACLALSRELAEAGVQGVGLAALDTEVRAVYDERFAAELADAGWFVAAMTPRKLAEHVGRLIG